MAEIDDGTELYSLTYISTAIPGLENTDLSSIIATSRSFNANVGVTGLLSYNGKSFIQCLEGGRNIVLDLTGKIGIDPRHTDLRVSWDGFIKQRSFSRWSMQFVDISQHRNTRAAELMQMLPDSLSELVRSHFRQYASYNY